MGQLSTAMSRVQSARRVRGRTLDWAKNLGLLLWLVAGEAAFLPFAFHTSPWNALTLHVPGNQGNWWHFLAAAPFFLALPMIGIRLHLLFAPEIEARYLRCAIWSLATLATAGTLLVESPFLLHLAGTSQWQRFIVIALGLGITIVSLVILWRRRRRIPPTRACMAALCTAYLANAALCLVVYAGAAGDVASRSGWFLTLALMAPMTLELAGHLSSRTHS